MQIIESEHLSSLLHRPTIAHWKQSPPELIDSLAFLLFGHEPLRKGILRVVGIDAAEMNNLRWSIMKPSSPVCL